jgi:hypothetical protein
VRCGLDVLDRRPTVGGQGHGQGRGKGRKMIRLPRRYRGWGKRKCTWIRQVWWWKGKARAVVHCPHLFT